MTYNPNSAADGAFVPSIQGLRGVAALSVLMDHFYDMPKGGVYDLPNPGFLPWHDLHHVATGYGTGLIGEAEISAYELRAGCGSERRHYTALPD